MTPNRKADSPVPTVTALLRGITRHAAHYAAQVRTMRTNRRLLAHRAVDTARAPEQPADLISPLRTAPPEVVSELMTLIRDQQAQLIAAAQRIGALEAQLAAGLTPEQARDLREELAACQARLAAQPHGPQPESAKPKKKRKKAQGGST